MIVNPKLKTTFKLIILRTINKTYIVKTLDAVFALRNPKT